MGWSHPADFPGPADAAGLACVNTVDTLDAAHVFLLFLCGGVLLVCQFFGFDLSTSGCSFCYDVFIIDRQPLRPYKFYVDKYGEAFAWISASSWL
jgi:hypothetical protein